jgi:DNA-binding NarL/FixJ family response regulator
METLLLADDHPLTLMGTKAFVETLGYRVVDLCSNGIAAYNGILTRQPAIALLDMNMPGMNGMEVLEKIQKARVPTRTVLLTMHNEVSIFNRAIALGSRGYLLKENAESELGGCLAAVLRGEVWASPELAGTLIQDSLVPGVAAGLEKLTLSEQKILRLVAAQRTSKEIGQMLFITEKTVENHRSSIIRKLGILPEKNALLIWAMKHAPF